jgi:hypothetical protein
MCVMLMGPGMLQLSLAMCDILRSATIFWRWLSDMQSVFLRSHASPQQTNRSSSSSLLLHACSAEPTSFASALGPEASLTFKESLGKQVRIASKKCTGSNLGYRQSRLTEQAQKFLEQSLSPPFRECPLERNGQWIILRLSVGLWVLDAEKQSHDAENRGATRRGHDDRRIEH